MGAVEDRLAARQVEGLGPAMFRRLAAQFGSWQAVREASDADLEQVPGVTRRLIRSLHATPEGPPPAAEVEAAARLGVRILADDDPAYPPALRPLEDRPLLLYVRGSLVPSDTLAVAVVGTRMCSAYGEIQAERLASALASAGVTVVSGLARGIDAAAHRGALRGRGRTLAVLGCGLGRVYPPEHQELADRIAESGALVSELPLDTPPLPGNFPVRNRIIAGLSLGVVIVEAGSHSGAMITARLAAELGREVFAVPGEISRPQSRGCHALIRDGARIVTDAAGVLQEIECLRGLAPEAGEAVEPPPPRLNQAEQAIYEALDESPRDIDWIVRETEMPPANAASTLMALELRGLVRQLPGNRFSRSARR